jgi:hypothetical protein
VDVVADHTAVHQLVGLLAIGVGIAVLLGASQLAACCAKPRVDPPVTGGPSAAAWPWIAVALALLGAAAVLPAPVTAVSARNWAALPQTLQLADRQWTATDLPLTDATRRRFPGGALHRRYRTAEGQVIDLVITDAGTRRDGLYDPATCLASSGHHLAGAGAARGLPVSMAKLNSEMRGQRFAHRTTFAVGGYFFRTYTAQQAGLLIARLLGRPADAVTVRVTVSIGPGADANTLADAAARQLMPLVQGRLTAGARAAPIGG